MFAVYFIAFAILLRLVFLVISIRHEKALKAAGAQEFGAANTGILALAHLLFCISAGIEGHYRNAAFDDISSAGLAVYCFGLLMLVLVIRLLGRFWTVKLILASDHQLVLHPLFRTVRHPNYFLNLLPELIGMCLTVHAFWTLAIGLPIYCIPLGIRIRQEEAAMRKVFPSY